MPIVGAIARELPGRPFGASGPSRTSFDPVNKGKPWHWELVELVVHNPTMTNEDLGKRLGRSSNSVGMLLRSDFVRARIAQRQAERRALSDELYRTELAETAIEGMKLLKQRITTNSDRMSNDQVIDANKTLLGALGFSPQRVGSEAPAQQVNIHLQVPASVLADARAQLRTIEAQALPEASPKQALPSPATSEEPTVMGGGFSDLDGR